MENRGYSREFLQKHRLRGLLIAFGCIFLYAPAAKAGYLNLAWDAPTTNVDGTPLTDLAEYRIYAGTSSPPPCPGSAFLTLSSTTPTPSPGDVIAYQLTGLTENITYFVQVTAVDTGGNESDCSNEASGTANPGSGGGSGSSGSVGNVASSGEGGGGGVLHRHGRLRLAHGPRGADPAGVSQSVPPFTYTREATGRRLQFAEPAAGKSDRTVRCPAQSCADRTASGPLVGLSVPVVTGSGRRRTSGDANYNLLSHPESHPQIPSGNDPSVRPSGHSSRTEAWQLVNELAESSRQLALRKALSAWRMARNAPRTTQSAKACRSGSEWVPGSPRRQG